MNILKDIINEILNKKKDYIILNCEPTIEMARINTKEFYGLFPYNKFDMRIWSNDHNPPHFHIKADGWEVVVDIENGNILKTISYNKKDSTMFSYIKDNIKNWLDCPNVRNKNITNRENAMAIWDMNHEET